MLNTPSNFERRLEKVEQKVRKMEESPAPGIATLSEDLGNLFDYVRAMDAKLNRVMEHLGIPPDSSPV